MPYQQGYDYGGYQGFGQTPQAYMYQTNHGQFQVPQQQQQQQQQQQHPMVVVPRENVSQYYTPLQSFQSPHPTGFYEQYPSQYEQATQQQYYYPQTQQSYSVPQQQSFQAQSMPNTQLPNQHVPSQTAYLQRQTVHPQALHSNNHTSYHQPSPDQSFERPDYNPAHHLLSSPDPLSTPQYQVQSRAMPAQLQSQSHPQSVRPQQRSQLPPRLPNESHPVPNSSQQRVVARVEIPRHHQNSIPAQSDMERSPKRRRSNDGQAMPVYETTLPLELSLQQQSSQQLLSSSLTELPSSQLPPTPPPSVDYRGVLLALADEYIAAAYSMTTSLASSEDADGVSKQYYRLMSTAMGCLQSALINYKQPDFRAEARLRLRLASLMLEETENDQEAEEVLSKGVALCERSRLSDLKYAMHHVLVRVTFKSRPKAALKAIDKLIHEVEALKLVYWTYTFRLLRVSLSLMMGGHSETAAMLKHLAAISETADDSRHVSVRIMAAVLETIVHIRSSAPDAAELAQRAITSARTHQLGPEIQQMPQARAILACFDLACCLVQSNPEQVAATMQQMHNELDTLGKAGWCRDGSMAINLAPTNNDELEQDTCGIMRRADNGDATLAFRWISKSQLCALGFLLSGIASTHISNGKPEKWLNEGLKLTKHSPDALSQSLSASLGKIEQWACIDVAIRVQTIFAYCGRFDWTAARNAIQEVRREYSDSGLAMDAGTGRSLLYLEGLCKHGLGELQAAVNLYCSPALVFEPDAKLTTAEKDLRVLASLNSIFILRTLGADQVSKADSLQAAVEPYCTKHTKKSIKAVYCIIKATAAESNTAIIKMKQYLQAAVDASKTAANNQLLCVCMNVMTATFFTHIVGDQAEKSAKAGRSLAKKGQDRLWMAVADGMFGDIMERCGKPAEAEAARREARSLTADLPESLKSSLCVDGT